MSGDPKQPALPLPPRPGSASQRNVPRRPVGDAGRLSGAVERVTFHSEETGFSVLRVKLAKRRELATVIGHAPSVSAGQFVEAEGRWEQDAKHGPQFRARELRVTAPTTREGIERYLGSGQIRGIGPALAERLVRRFGSEVFQVIEREPARLSEVAGVGEVRSRRLVEAWAEQRHVRDIMLFLHSHGVGTARAVRIHRTYGERAIDKIREDPYRLARDIRGIGFLTADALAKRLGTAPTAPSRLRAGIRHVLGVAHADGHCGLPCTDLLGRARELLAVDPARLERALEDEAADGAVVLDEAGGQACAFLAGLYGMERSAARSLLDLAVGAPPWPAIDAARALPWVETRLGLELASSQREAVEKALCSKLLILTGGPGVGKTTLVRAILEILRAKGTRTALAAPTGRAAKRLSEATGLEARTIHRMLEADPSSGGFKRNKSRPLECDLVVIDETSMVDVPLMFALLAAIPRSAALLLVGDADQLPSVGPGQVLADAIGSGAVPVVRLREIFRQASRSRIVRSAHRINEGRMPEIDSDPDTDSDFFFLETPDPDTAAERLLSVVCERIPARFSLDPIRDIQVLCPMHRGRLGARSLNLELQAALNPPERARARIERFGWTYALGDKVMQIENDYEKDVYNGDVGFIQELDPVARELEVEFDGRRVVYDFDELDRLVLAYATTVHKAQGSEYPAVVLPLSTQHYPMLKRNLIYTGITRGQKLVVLIGERRALAIAIRAATAARRFTKLGDWLRQASDL